MAAIILYVELGKEIGRKFSHLLESPFFNIRTTLACSCSSGMFSFIHQSFRIPLNISRLTSGGSLKNSIGNSSGPGAFLLLIFVKYLVHFCFSN